MDNSAPTPLRLPYYLSAPPPPPRGNTPPIPEGIPSFTVTISRILVPEKGTAVKKTDGLWEYMVERLKWRGNGTNGDDNGNENDGINGNSNGGRDGNGNGNGTGTAKGQNGGNHTKKRRRGEDGYEPQREGGGRESGDNQSGGETPNSGGSKKRSRGSPSSSNKPNSPPVRPASLSPTSRRKPALVNNKSKNPKHPYDGLPKGWGVDIEIITYDSPIEGKIEEWMVKKGDVLWGNKLSRTIVKVLEDCTHPVQWGGLCTICGKVVDQQDWTGVSQASRANIQMAHDESQLTVSLAEATRLEKETATRLRSSRKLSLIVDLDQTIIHATVDPTVGEWMDDPDDPNHEALKDVGVFLLPPERRKGLPAPPPGVVEGCRYYVKPRPGLKEFLMDLAQLYEMHVYTMGTRGYASAVCTIIDPDGEFFRGRILTRDESGSFTHKSLQRLFPCDQSMVVVIDDRADIWDYSPNLVKVYPYDFFVGIGDINAPFNPKPPPAPPTGGITPTVVAPATNANEAEGEERPGEVADAEAQLAIDQQVAARPLARKQKALDADHSHTHPHSSNKKDRNPSADSPDSVSPLPEAKDGCAAESEEILQDEKLSDLAPNNDESQEPKEEDSPSSSVRPGAQDVATDVPPPGTSKEESSTTPSDTEMPQDGTKSQPSEGEAKVEDSEAPDGPAEEETDSSLWSSRAPVLKDDDVELSRILEILADIHSRFYAEAGGDADVAEILDFMKSQVLAGTQIVFSGIIPLQSKPEDSVYWRVAEQFGARCHINWHDDCTHLVTSKPDTHKAYLARQKPGVYIVNPTWLEECQRLWRRVPETDYLFNVPGYHPPVAEHMDSRSPSPAVDQQFKMNGTPNSKKPGGEENMTGTATPVELRFDDVDWEKADEEVDAAMNEDTDDDDDDDDDDSNGNSSDSERFTPSDKSEQSNPSSSQSTTPRTTTRKKRARESTGGHENSDNEDDREEGKSPLSKRRKVAVERTGSQLSKTAVVSEVAEDQIPEPAGDSEAEESSIRDDDDEEGDVDEYAEGGEEGDFEERGEEEGDDQEVGEEEGEDTEGFEEEENDEEGVEESVGGDAVDTDDEEFARQMAEELDKESAEEWG